MPLQKSFAKRRLVEFEQVLLIYQLKKSDGYAGFRTKLIGSQIGTSFSRNASRWNGRPTGAITSSLTVRAYRFNKSWC